MDDGMTVYGNNDDDAGVFQPHDDIGFHSNSTLQERVMTFAPQVAGNVPSTIAASTVNNNNIGGNNLYCFPAEGSNKSSNDSRHYQLQHQQLQQQQQHQHHHHQQHHPSFGNIVNYWHIKDDVLPMPNKLDKFLLWPDGYQQLVYDARNQEASGHQSGWAMRNTNNHDSSRLKKSCLGVMLCSMNCKEAEGNGAKALLNRPLSSSSSSSSSSSTSNPVGSGFESKSESGDFGTVEAVAAARNKKRREVAGSSCSGGTGVGGGAGSGGCGDSGGGVDSPRIHVRPFICDKARSKQKGLPCPTAGCSGVLAQVKCTGHGGKPVTHVWRSLGSLVYFQCKGVHDHPRPEPKSTSTGKKKQKLQNDAEEQTTMTTMTATRKRRLAIEKLGNSERRTKKKKDRRSNPETTEVSSTTVDCGGTLIGKGSGEFQQPRTTENLEVDQYFQSTAASSTSSTFHPQSSSHLYFQSRNHLGTATGDKEMAYYKNESTYTERQLHLPQFACSSSSSESLYSFSAERPGLAGERRPFSAGYPEERGAIHPTYPYYDHYTSIDYRRRQSDHCYFGDSSYQQLQRRPHSNQSAHDYRQQHQQHYQQLHYHQNFSTAPSAPCSSLGSAEPTLDWSFALPQPPEHTTAFRSGHTAGYQTFNSYENNPSLNPEYITIESQSSPSSSTPKNQNSLFPVRSGMSSLDLAHFEIPDQRSLGTGQHHLAFVGSSPHLDAFDTDLTRAKSESGTYFKSS